MKKLAWISCLTLLLLTSSASAKDVFVAGYGFDGPPNTGLTVFDPFATITFAVGPGGVPLFPGDRILVMPGLYDTASGEVFPLHIPTGVSLIGVGGALVTTISDGVVIWTGPNTHSMMTGFTFSDPPGAFAFGVFLSGGGGAPWPTVAATIPPTSPVIGTPTFADNIHIGNGLGIPPFFGIGTSSIYGPIAAQVRDNLSYYSGVDGFVNVGAAGYPATSTFDQNTATYNAYYGIRSYAGGGAAYPLLRSNLAAYNGVSGLTTTSLGPPAFTYDVNTTAIGNGLYGALSIVGGPVLHYSYNGIFYYNPVFDHEPYAFAVGFPFTSDVGTPPVPPFFNVIAIPPILGPGGVQTGPVSPTIDQGLFGGFFIGPAHFFTGQNLISPYDAFSNSRVLDYVGIYNAYVPDPGYPYPDMGAHEIVNTPPCLAGNVNTGNGISSICFGSGIGVVDTIFVNGSSGGAGRTVQASGSVSISVALTDPPLGSSLPTKYFVGGWLGVPGPGTFALWPAGLGTACFPFGTPTIAANTGTSGVPFSTPEATSCTQPCIVLDIPPFTLAPGTIMTFQGATTDFGGPASITSGTRCASITNAVICTVLP